MNSRALAKFISRSPTVCTTVPSPTKHFFFPLYFLHTSQGCSRFRLRQLVVRTIPMHQRVKFVHRIASFPCKNVVSQTDPTKHMHSTHKMVEAIIEELSSMFKPFPRPDSTNRDEALKT